MPRAWSRPSPFAKPDQALTEIPPLIDGRRVPCQWIAQPIREHKTPRRTDVLPVHSDSGTKTQLQHQLRCRIPSELAAASASLKERMCPYRLHCSSTLMLESSQCR